MITDTLQHMSQRRIAVGSLRCSDIGASHQQADPARPALGIIIKVPEPHTVVRQ